MASSTSSAPARATQEQIKQLSDYASCEISDALVKLKVPHAGFIPDLDIVSHGKNKHSKVIGEAYTVKMVDSADKDAPKLEGHFVDLAPSGSIMVISSPPHVKSASLGGLLAVSAAVRGVQGVVIDGRCRDLAEIRDIKLAVFARGHSTVGQSPFTRPSEIQVPITITPTSPYTSSNPPPPTVTPFPAITIRPFDIVLGDIDGVVVVQPEMIKDVLEIAKVAKELDEKCMKDLLEGKGVKETFARHRGAK
ncbi:RraA-like protein [Meredithblackwellia eburnea MCA 4105]